jgi:tryptophanyl-tRNA synthetase
LRREELAKDLPAVWDILYKGSEEARAVAADTLSEMKKAMKIDYFADRK